MCGEWSGETTPHRLSALRTPRPPSFGDAHEYKGRGTGDRKSSARKRRITPQSIHVPGGVPRHGCDTECLRCVRTEHVRVLDLKCASPASKPWAARKASSRLRRRPPAPHPRRALGGAPGRSLHRTASAACLRPPPSSGAAAEAAAAVAAGVAAAAAAAAAAAVAAAVVAAVVATEGGYLTRVCSCRAMQRAASARRQWRY